MKWGNIKGTFYTYSKFEHSDSNLFRFLKNSNLVGSKTRFELMRSNLLPCPVEKLVEKIDVRHLKLIEDGEQLQGSKALEIFIDIEYPLRLDTVKPKHRSMKSGFPHLKFVKILVSISHQNYLWMNTLKTWATWTAC